jgi:hypothetical protein
MKRIVIFAVAFTFALAQFSSVDAQFQEGGAIAGRVAGPARPLGGVTVQAIDAAGSIAGSAATSDAGMFRIVDLRPGTYTVHVLSANGRAIATASATLAADSGPVTLSIEATAGTMAGAATGVPAAAPRGGGINARLVLASVGAAAASLGTLLVISTNEDVSGSR